MLLQRPLSTIALAIAAALPLGLPSNTSAQTQYQTQYQPQYQQALPGVTAFGVDQIDHLRPGEVLVFRLDGPPDARVSLQIAGTSVPVQMNEVSPGRYEGSYTIRRQDRLNGTSMVTAQVLKNGQTSTAMLSQSLLAGAADPVAAAPSQINAFQVTAPQQVRPGDELLFSLTGTPGGQAGVALQGVVKRIALSEVRPGVYEASYVVRRSDKIRGSLVADAHLLSNRRDATMRYTAAQNGGNSNSDGLNRPAATCANCGSVTAVRLVTVKGDSPNVIGTIAGGVLGGVLGSQVGGGSGKDLATIAGAIGGAYAGNRVENNMDKTKVHRVSVRLDNGTTRSFDYAESPGLAVGARVKVENNALARL